jgi:hypothetical protein
MAEARSGARKFSGAGMDAPPLGHPDKSVHSLVLRGGKMFNGGCPELRNAVTLDDLPLPAPI